MVKSSFIPMKPSLAIRTVFERFAEPHFDHHIE